MNAILQLFSKIVEFFFKISEFGHLSQKTRSSRLDAGLYSSFWKEKENPIIHQPTPCNYIMELKMSQLIDGRFKFTKTKIYFSKLPHGFEEL